MQNRRIKPIKIRNIKFENGFWSDKLELLLTKMIPFQWKVLNDEIEDAPSSHAVENFRIAAGEKKGEFKGRVFQDSDVAKWLEALSYSLEIKSSTELEAIADELIDLIAQAQKPDGYINTYFSIAEPKNKWKNLRDNHELYCAGHLIEAAVAYYEATKKDKFLKIMIRFVDHIDNLFGPEAEKKQGYPGHEEIELALLKLYRITNEKKHINLANYFLNQRGKAPNYFIEEMKERGSENTYLQKNKAKHGLKYSQSHQPILKQEKAVGHAVRAMYLYTAIADMANQNNDQKLKETSIKLWNDVIETKLYITGGIGSSFFDGEAITINYDLPNDRAYTETCAAVGLILWAYKMFLLHQDSQYNDVIEKTLYNGLLSGVSLSGTEYFYVNPLEVWPEAVENRGDLTHVKPVRQKWFETACCPTNLARLLGSIGKYIYSQTEKEVFVNQYTASKAQFNFNNSTFTITQRTNYPWEEKIILEIEGDAQEEFEILLRIPAWCEDANLKINGQAFDLNEIIENGYARINRKWYQDQVELVLKMTIKKIFANPNLRENIGKVALQRGPIIYALEEIDNGKNLSSIFLDGSIELKVEHQSDLLEGVTIITGEAYKINNINWDHKLYRFEKIQFEKVNIKAVPYYSWNNRGKGEMLVWINQILSI